MNSLATLTEKLATALRDPTFDTWAPDELEDLLNWSLSSLSAILIRPLDPETQIITLVVNDYFYPLPPAVMRISRVDWVDTFGSEQGPLVGGSWEVVGDPEAYTGMLHVAPDIVAQGGTMRLTGYGSYTLYPALTTTLAAGAALAATNLRLTAVTDLSVGDILTLGTNIARVTAVGTAGAGGTGVTITPGLAVAALIGAAVVEVSRLPKDGDVPLILARARAEALRRMMGNRARYEQWLVQNQTANMTMNELAQMLTDSERDVKRWMIERRMWQKPVPGRT